MNYKLCFLEAVNQRNEVSQSNKRTGARTNTSIPYSSGRIVRLNILPVPRNSRTAPNKVNAIVKPNPIPKPSKKDATGLFLAAKASARPSTIQFTTISGINKPNAHKVRERKPASPFAAVLRTMRLQQ